MTTWTVCIDARLEAESFSDAARKLADHFQALAMAWDDDSGDRDGLIPRTFLPGSEIRIGC